MWNAFLERTRKAKGLLVVVALVVAVCWSAISGPQGVQSLWDKWSQIQDLEARAQQLEEENEVYRRRIQRLEQSPNEQEMEVRKQLKLLKPGETTFILPDDPDEKVIEIPAPESPK